VNGYVWIKLEIVGRKPGPFLMGSPDSERGRGIDEVPQHEVTITKGFYLGKYEVTQRQWVSVMGTRPWAGGSYVVENPDHPAVYVSWNDAQEFIGRLNAVERVGVYRLPTEAEWEYACRAGTTTRWSFGDDESRLGEYAWYNLGACLAGECYARKVGMKLPNPWGLYDMHGNVWEWCQDWYYWIYPADAQVDPTGPGTGSARVVRGGFFNGYAWQVRSARRNAYSPSGRLGIVGFRLLR
jgi:formylglycine-generating enzyme required for sulfatase activity